MPFTHLGPGGQSEHKPDPRTDHLIQHAADVRKEVAEVKQAVEQLGVGGLESRLNECETAIKELSDVLHTVRGDSDEVCKAVNEQEEWRRELEGFLAKYGPAVDDELPPLPSPPPPAPEPITTIIRETHTVTKYASWPFYAMAAVNVVLLVLKVTNVI